MAVAAESGGTAYVTGLTWSSDFPASGYHGAADAFVVKLNVEGLSEYSVLLGGSLGVKRSYRCRGIGLAMQLRGIAYARENGIALLKTCTGIINLPMQSLFDKLGYVRDPEWQQCQKNIPQIEHLN